jgi:hypothetical protein
MSSTFSQSEGESQPGSAASPASSATKAEARVRAPLLLVDFVLSSEPAQLGFCVALVPHTREGLLQVAPLVIECLLPQVELPLIQTQFALQFSLVLPLVFSSRKAFSLNSLLYTFRRQR